MSNANRIHPDITAIVSEEIMLEVKKEYKEKLAFAPRRKPNLLVLFKKKGATSEQYQGLKNLLGGDKKIHEWMVSSVMFEVPIVDTALDDAIKLANERVRNKTINDKDLASLIEVLQDVKNPKNKTPITNVNTAVGFDMKSFIEAKRQSLLVAPPEDKDDK